MTKELIIATYNRPYEWISEIDKTVKVTVYTKNQINVKNKEILIKPNVGRDVHTFFYHIVEKYDDLSEYTFFSQDHYIEHVENYINIINGDISVWNNNAKQHFEEYWCFQNAPYLNWTWKKSTQFGGDVLECDYNGNPNHPNLNIKNAWNVLFDNKLPDSIEFVPGGHFCASKKQIKIRSKKFYQKILAFLEFDYSAPWIIERLEPYIFNSSIKAYE